MRSLSLRIHTLARTFPRASLLALSAILLGMGRGVVHAKIVAAATEISAAAIMCASSSTTYSSGWSSSWTSSSWGGGGGGSGGSWDSSSSYDDPFAYSKAPPITSRPSARGW